MMKDRFEVVSRQRLGGEKEFYDYKDEYGDFIEILRDTQTGVLYMRSTHHETYNAGVGLTVMVDKDGKPLTSYKVNI